MKGYSTFVVVGRAVMVAAVGSVEGDSTFAFVVQALVGVAVGETAAVETVVV